jgi:type IV secretory pathway protease TraF
MTRIGWVMTTYVSALVACVTVLLHPSPRLIWNASASVPIGLYAVHPAVTLRTNELLVVTPPEPLATFLGARRYLPKGIPLMTHVAALPGQTVCRTGETVTIDGITVGAALDRDHLGRSNVAAVNWNFPVRCPPRSPLTASMIYRSCRSRPRRPVIWPGGTAIHSTGCWWPRPCISV